MNKELSGLRPSTSKQKKKIAVIGSGVAGLSAATRLAASGHEVHIFEKNSYPGGKLTFFKLGEYSFDAGPSLFTQPHLIEDLFDFCGENIRPYFTYQKMDVACHYFFPSGKTLVAPANPDKLAIAMAKQLGEDEKKVQAYLKRAAHSYKHLGELFLTKSLHKWGTFLHKKVFAAILATRPSYLLQSMDVYNQASFDKAESVQLFNRYATYNGSNPYTAPAMLTMIPHLEFNEGTFYPQGGMISITNALVSLAQKMGVTLHYGAEVTKIEVTDKKVNGLTVNGKKIAFDSVVSNMDAYYTYKRLISNEQKAKHIRRQERSSSALIFYWGINRQFEQLHLHNIFFSADYPQEFNHLFRTKTMFDDPTIYINITSKVESSQAAQGGENWFVMVNAPHDTGQNWDVLRKQTRDRVIAKLNRMLNTDIEQHILVEDYLDPTLIDNRTHSHTGSLYGTSSNSRFAAFLRHPNFSSQIQGLFFAGGSVHPGGGIPLCMQSGKIAAELIESTN